MEFKQFFTLLKELVKQNKVDKFCKEGDKNILKYCY